LHKEYKVVTLGQITVNKDRRDESILLRNGTAYLNVWITTLAYFQFNCKLAFLNRCIVAGSKIDRFVPATPE